MSCYSYFYPRCSPLTNCCFNCSCSAFSPPLLFSPLVTSLLLSFPEHSIALISYPPFNSTLSHLLFYPPPPPCLPHPFLLYLLFNLLSSSQLQSRAAQCHEIFSFCANAILSSWLKSTASSISSCLNSFHPE